MLAQQMRAVAAARLRPSSAPAGGRKKSGAGKFSSNSSPAAAESSSFAGISFPETDSVGRALRSAGATAEEQERRIWNELSGRGRLTVLGGCPSAPSWTLPGKPPAASWARNSCAPGPGTYSLKPSVQVGGGSSFGKHPGSITHSVGEGSKVGVLGGDSPGPVYNTRPNVNKQRGGDIGAGKRFSEDAIRQQPGPGEYPLTSTLSQAGVAIPAGGRTSGRPRSAPPRLQLLLPPSRAAPRSTPPKWSIGTSIRPPLGGHGGGNDHDASHYNLPTTLGGGAASLRAGSVPPVLGEWEIRPEPATYYPCSARSNHTAGGFARATRPTSAPAVRDPSGTGPGSYTVASQRDVHGTPLIRARSAEALKGAAMRRARTGSNPGPKYDIARALSRQQVTVRPAFSIGRGSRPSPCNTSAAPGPGKYGLPPDRCTTNSRPSYAPRFGKRRAAGGKLGGGAREARYAARHATKPWPSPGSYDPQRPGSQTAVVIGTGRRRPLAVGSSSAPGPGHYGAPPIEKTTHGSCINGISMAKGERGADGKLKPGDFPGPGYYKAYSSFG